MTAPTFVASSAGANSASTTALTALSGVDLSNCALAIVIVLKNGGGAGETLSVDAGSSSGWTKLSQQLDGTSVTVAALFYKVAPTASETLIVDASSGVNGVMTSMVVRLAGANNIGAVSGTTWDPPSDATGVTQDYLWIAAASYGSTTTFLGGPTGYSNFAHYFDGQTCTQAVATKDGTASQTEDPSAFSASGVANRKISWTIATWQADPIVAGHGTIAGTATVAAVASARACGTTAPAGIGSLAAAAAATKCGTLASAGIGALAGHGASLHCGLLAASGAATVAGIASSIHCGTGAVIGIAALTAQGALVKGGIGAMTGSAAVIANGAGIACGTGFMAGFAVTVGQAGFTTASPADRIVFVLPETRLVAAPAEIRTVRPL